MIQIHSLERPIQIDSVRSCDVPQVWASSIVDHLDHCRTVFENVQLDWVRAVWNVEWNVVH